MYRTLDEYFAALDDAVSDALADSGGEVGEDDIYHDVAQSLGYDLAPELRAEASRALGFPSVPGGSDPLADDEAWV